MFIEVAMAAKPQIPSHVELVLPTLLVDESYLASSGAEVKLVDNTQGTLDNKDAEGSPTDSKQLKEFFKCIEITSQPWAIKYFAVKTLNMPMLCMHDFIF